MCKHPENAITAVNPIYAWDVIKLHQQITWRARPFKAAIHLRVATCKQSFVTPIKHHPLVTLLHFAQL
jgi:hypothetical protein